ncbi:hypothetical protein [Microbaculum marinisediminis]|uniref:Amino acid permease n=1 Tax=Microbaculum marinisediminis TaxID=2931392 RepID=A0AAW5R2N7_9HYPH|nr:hypothetical protein [Microbaculum sp. A6E488]MCT8974541.1 hypothetical protein [Microbaculum sp. A6E488]
MIANAVAITTALAVAAFVLSPRVRASSHWRATVTPLASIIGSGFLVSLPILTSAVGHYAIVAMAALLGLSYLFGSAIRFNIRYGEPMFAEEGPSHLMPVERMSHIALAFAYFISVAYYLTLLSAFLLKAIGLPDPLLAQSITTAILVAIGAFGLWKGLHGLEGVEEYAVGLKLAIIAAVLAALALLNINLLVAGDWAPAHVPGVVEWDDVRIVLGLLIVVQGFETSRFLAGEYPPDTRIRTMRLAQFIAGAIYLAFFALALVVAEKHPVNGDVAVMIDLVAAAAPVLPIMLAAGAVFAQLSAAIADAIASAGLIQEETRGAIRRRGAYPVIAAIGVLIVWSTDVFSIIALSSRAFALFYALQCVVAAQVALRAPDVDRRRLRALGFVVLAVLAFAAAVFGLPSEGGE